MDGKKVKSIIEETGVEAIDTQDDGIVKITAKDLSSLEESKSIIINLTMVPTVGDIYRNCEIKSVAPYGVLVEIAPGREGLCHICELTSDWLAKAEDVNDKGQLRLSCRALLPVPQTNPEEPNSKQLTSNPAEVISDSGKVSDKRTPKKYVNVPKADGLAEKKIEQAKDKSSDTKLPSSSKSNSAENTLLPQKKVLKRIRKSSSKAVTGVSGKDVE